MKRRNQPKQDELTTDMHYEFLEEEISREDLYVMGVYGAMGRGASKAEALVKYNMTEEFYDANIDRVLHS